MSIKRAKEDLVHERQACTCQAWAAPALQGRLLPGLRLSTAVQLEGVHGRGHTEPVVTILKCELDG